jgi:hypothetical protein
LFGGESRLLAVRRDFFSAQICLPAAAILCYTRGLAPSRSHSSREARDFSATRKIVSLSFRRRDMRRQPLAAP